MQVRGFFLLKIQRPRRSTTQKETSARMPTLGSGIDAKDHAKPYGVAVLVLLTL